MTCFYAEEIYGTWFVARLIYDSSLKLQNHWIFGLCRYNPIIINKINEIISAGNSDVVVTLDPTRREMIPNIIFENLLSAKTMMSLHF
jgi:hypothetical protein